MKAKRTGGGWAAVFYSLRLSRRVGWLNMWRAMSSRNACKTCAVGMGGQKGGMVNETGHWPEVCKKSFQAMAADMQGALTPDFFARYSIAHLKTLSPRELEHAGRLVQPLYAAPGATHYKPIEWNEALDRLANAMKATQPRRTFFYVSGRSSNEAGFLLQLFARAYGTNHVSNCSYYCHQASGVGLAQSVGTGTATVSLEDVDKSDLLFLIGGNPASNHPRLMRTMMQLRRRGGKVVVINPVREVGLVNFSVPSDVRSLLFGTRIASTYVQPHIGGDLALLTGIAKSLMERGGVDQAFIDSATDGFAEYRAAVEALSWDELSAQSGIDRTQIEELADVYRQAKSVVFAWTMGITHHQHGVANVQAIVNLALLRGMVGRPGAGLMPIRGHSNVQGIGSMGVTPALKQAVLERLDSVYGLKPPTWPGMDTMATMEAADRGEFDVSICLGGNLFGSNPDANFAAKSMNSIPLVAYLNTSLNTGHAWGLGRETLILPVQARDEEQQRSTQESMFNYVRISDGGKPRHEGPRSESSVFADLAERVLGPATGPIEWTKLHSHAELRQAIAKIVPGYEAVGEVDRSNKEFAVAGRIFHQAEFPTPSGRAKFRADPLPERHLDDDELWLMTCRSEGQFNTVVFEETDIYRGQDRRDVILMSPEDIERFGFREDQQVTVSNDTGKMEGILVRPYDIRAGNALMYYPEANVLVPRTLDPQSKTPAFKSVAVKLKAAVPTPQLVALS